MLIWTLVLILALAAAAYAAGNARAAGLSTAGGTRLHSLPAYHGLYVAAGALTGGLALALAGGVLFGAQSWLATLAAAAGAVIGIGSGTVPTGCCTGWPTGSCGVGGAGCWATAIPRAGLAAVPISGQPPTPPPG